MPAPTTPPLVVVELETGEAEGPGGLKKPPNVSVTWTKPTPPVM
jgi:hypothetical protein